MIARGVWRLITLAISIAIGASTLSAGEKPLTIVAFGDSLTAGFGLPAADAFPVRLEAALSARGHHVVVINAGVSGDTTDMGLARLDWSLPDDADAVIVELGANDALRGVDPRTTRANLDAIVARLGERGLPVLVAGMAAPRNLGAEYAQAFDPMFGEIAAARGALFYPFFLDGVALDPALNQADGMHPKATGVGIIVDRMLPKVEALIALAEARRP